MSLTPEQSARAYCHSIGADPDEMIRGVDHHFFGHRGLMIQARWRWYVGAKIQHKHAAE